MTVDPRTELDARYSDDIATATPWAEAREALAAAELYWLTTVRPEGGPHMTPLIGVLHADALHFCTGPAERKGRNLAANELVVMSTGTNTLHAGLDLVVEGAAERVTDESALRALAGAWLDKYGEEWHFGVHDGAFTHTGGGAAAHVFRVVPTVAYAFAKDPYSHTRYTFA